MAYGWGQTLGRTATSCIVLVSLVGCHYFTNQGYRANRAYDIADRGEEEYEIRMGTNSTTDSLEAAKAINAHLSDESRKRTERALCTIFAFDPSSARYYQVFCPPQGNVPLKPSQSLFEPNRDTTSALDLRQVAWGTLPRIAPNGQHKSDEVAPTEHDPSIWLTGDAEAPGVTEPGNEYPKEPTTPGNNPSTIDKSSAAQLVQQAPGLSEGPLGAEAAPGVAGTGQGLISPLYNYSLTKYWPGPALQDLIRTTDKQHHPTIVRELNNILWLQSLRDLLTEPGLYSQLPQKRKVKLACAPPPEQTAIQTAASFLAKGDYKGAGGTLEARLAESTIKLFEQTERTVFLQYAMFRLCEMGINSAGEFRHAFPLVMQELVRQAATLTLEASVEEQRAAAARAQAAAAQAKVESQRLECVKLQQKKKSDITSGDVARFCGAAPKVAVGESPLTPVPPSQPENPGSS